GTAQLGLALLDDDPARLQKLAQYLLHVQRIPLALFGEDLEELFRNLLCNEQSLDHPPDVASLETLERDRLRSRRGPPGRRITPSGPQTHPDGVAGKTPC